MIIDIIEFTIAGVFSVIFVFVLPFYLRRKCSYDCSKCNNYLCDYHHCKRNREKLESKAKEQ